MSDLSPKIEIRRIAHEARKAAVFYEDKPAMASDPRVVIDLYRTIARLCDKIDAQSNT